jgi:serine/threonine-protein kinase
MGMKRTLLGFATCGLLVLNSSYSQAQEHSNKKVAAEALFEQGRGLLEAKRFREACAKFEASQALDAGIGTLLYLGDCYEHTGRTASAWATFREAESLARANAQEERAQIARARAAALEPKMSKVVIRVPRDSRTNGLSIRLGQTNVPPASWGIPLPIDAGDQRVEASAPGRKPWHAVVHVPRGDSFRYAVMVPRLELSSTVSYSQKKYSDPGKTLRTLGVVTGATGIAGLGAGAVFSALASRKNDDYRQACPASSNRCSEDGLELRSQSERYSDVATASFAAGGGLLLTGFVFYLVAPSDKGERSGVSLSPQLDKRTAITLTPTVDSKSLGMRVRGWW